MNEQLATPDDMKQLAAIPNAGAHVIGSYLVSKDLESVEMAVNQFAEDKLGMRPVQE